MSMPRYAAKVDLTQRAIVEALRGAGVFVWIIGRPVDLLTYFRGSWELLECGSSPAKLKRKDQEEQQAFCKAFDVPVVLTPEAALKAVGATK